MPNSSSFVVHALDLMEGFGAVEAKRMFGGHGLYTRGVMFGLLDDDELFLKTDEQSRPTFRAAGCRPWIYAGRKGDQETSYFRPPEDAHESPEAMRPWATLALEAALRKAASKKPAPKKARSTPSPQRKGGAPASRASRVRRR